MIRASWIFLVTVAALTAPALAQNERRPDEYVRAYGFSVDIKSGAPDEGWEHISDALLTISHSSASAAAKPESLPETVMKFTMRDANDNRAGIELGPCRSNTAAICLYITTVELPKSSQAWLKTLLQANAGRTVEHRNLLITVVKGNGEKRTYNLVDTFPQSFNYVDVAAEGNAGGVIHWTLEVRVQRVEMA